jgi:hypothetical protein
MSQTFGIPIGVNKQHRLGSAATFGFAGRPGLAGGSAGVFRRQAETAARLGNDGCPTGHPARHADEPPGSTHRGIPGAWSARAWQSAARRAAVLWPRLLTAQPPGASALLVSHGPARVVCRIEAKCTTGNVLPDSGT